MPEEYNLDYLGVDIIDELLDYAKTKAPKNYRFIKHQELSVPAKSESVDMICAFSLFTHLTHHESFIYLQEMHRVLKPKGILVFSFLEFESLKHWSVFLSTVESQKNGTLPHLNTFIEKSVIKIWADKLNFEIIEIFEEGQTMVILKRK